MHAMARAFTGILVALLILISSPATAIELRQIVAGLSSPVFVANAGDGSRRLFVVEQPGTIKVLQPGASVPTTFLDIQARVLSSGERGLLGLAFHPLYGSNGRFFVFYTRTPDGTIVIAEYRVSNNPNVSGTSETVLLQIPHGSFANHNGGMLAFGPGGYLYAGIGDGGSGNDPQNNAQNIESLLGKLLRINVDQANAAAGTPYTSPTGNPFLNAPGRDEIFAYGLRNPWRFSFDRQTSQLWIGDVGQGAREEVNTPVVAGMNFGWRVYEGFVCTNVDTALCGNSYTRPLFDYAHSGGRCSLTGGYVYRGTANTLPQGLYVYGDFCSGELFAWDSNSQSVLLATGRDVSSFGEDEEGELYVVSNSGRISRIVGSGCSVLAFPSTTRLDASAGTVTVQVQTSSGCAWSASSDSPWISFPSGTSGSGNGTLTVAVSKYYRHLWARTGSLTVGGQTFEIVQGRQR